MRLNMDVNKMDICGKKASVCGQCVVCIEVFPNDIALKCPGFSTEFSKCRLSHPNLDQHRQAVIIINVGYKLFYLAYELDIYVHDGIPTYLVPDYIHDFTRKGCTIVSMEHFFMKKNTLLLSGLMKLSIYRTKS